MLFSAIRLCGGSGDDSGSNRRRRGNSRNHGHHRTLQRRGHHHLGHKHHEHHRLHCETSVHQAAALRRRQFPSISFKAIFYSCHRNFWVFLIYNITLCRPSPVRKLINFQAMAKTCCKVPLPDLLAINIKNKVAACGAIGHQIFFNLYHLHKLQDVRNGNKIDFKGKLANSPLAIRAVNIKANIYFTKIKTLLQACFVNCYLKSLNLVDLYIVSL